MPLPLHCFAPGVQVVAQLPHDPPAQNWPLAHGVTGLHTVQLLLSVTHVSTPLPSHCEAPTVHVVPHTPHAPPLQKFPHVWPATHDVQPLESATHVSTVFPLHFLAPAVQVLLQA